MNKLYLISDQHFGHKNMIDYENRPFKDVDEMYEILIKNWNSIVTKGDTVICLGDFSFYNKEITTQIISQLKGRKELILGNHDRRKSVTWWMSTGFDIVYKYPVCIDGFYWLSHEPMYMNRGMPYVNIHGHLHSKDIGDGILPFQHFNVSVEKIGYKPINFEVIKNMFKGE